MNLDDRFALSLDELDMVQGGQGKCFGGSGGVAVSPTTSLKGGCAGGWGGGSVGFEDPSAQWGSSFGALDPGASMGNACNASGWSDPSASFASNGSADWGNAFGASDASSSGYGGGSFAADSSGGSWGGSGGGGGWGGSGGGGGCW